jgi:UPF0716 protein FxsA
MLGRLLLLFLLTPAVELGILIQVDQFIGFGPTIALIVATGIAGSYLARREGLNTWRRLNERLNAGDLPGKELVDGVIILVAGALLVTPGVLTDVIGFLGLIPPTRALIRRVLLRRFRSKMEEGSMQVQFGFFGGAAPGPNGTSPGPSSGPSDPSPSAADQATPNWSGQAQQMPDHSQDPSSDADDASSGRSDER